MLSRYGDKHVQRLGRMEDLDWPGTGEQFSVTGSQRVWPLCWEGQAENWIPSYLSL